MNEITKIIKRSGETVDFDYEKIKNAIKKAFISSKEIIIDEEFDDILNQLTIIVVGRMVKKFTIPNVEEIQDEVVNVLLDKNYRKTALQYSNYRAEQQNKREKESYDNLTKIFDDITKNGVESIVTKGSSGNGNVSVSEPMGKMLSYGAEASKQYALNHLISKRFADAHKNGDIHIHDVDFYPTKTLTCVQMDLDKLFKNGFSTGHGYVREPNSIQSYAQLTAIALQANQNNQHGGQSVPAFDYYMAPGVRKSFNKNLIHEIASSISDMFDIWEGISVEREIKENEFFKHTKIAFKKEVDEYDIELILNQICHISEKIYSFIRQTNTNRKRMKRLIAKDIVKAYYATNKDTYQAMEGLIHNLNTMHSRAGAQVPFTSLNFGTDTSEEGRMVTKNFLLATEAGLGNGETPIFPISIFKLKDGISANPNDPNYDLFELAIRVTSKRLFPNFSFIDAPFNKQYYVEGKPETEVAYMGCRTRVMANVCGDEVVTGRGNCSFTTINLPRLAIKAKLAYPNNDQEEERIEFFYKKFEEMLDLCKDQLLERLAFQGTATKENFNFLMGQNIWRGSENLGYNESLANVIKQGTLSIGFIGLAETLKCLIGKHHGESEKAESLGKEIIGFMREYTDRQTEEYKLNFTTLGTPAEGLCLSGDTLVQTPNGNTEISKIKAGDVVVTLNEDTNHFELDEVVFAGQTGIRDDIYEITFDTGQKLICTSNHPLAIRTMGQDKLGRITGEKIEYIPAEKIKEGMRVKSAYRHVSDGGYLRYCYKKDGVDYMHKMVYEYETNQKVPKGYVIHHIDGDKLNNKIENLKLMSDADHRILHMKNTIEKFKYTSEDMVGEKNTFWGKHHTEETKEKICKTKGCQYISPEICAKDFYEGLSAKEISEKYNIHYSTICKKLREAGVSLEKNHIVTSVKKLNIKIPVYDITMKTNHNFIVGGDNGVVVHNSGRFTRIDQSVFGTIEGVTDKEWYTNSFHIPVEYDILAIDKIKKEAPYHALCNAGHISYVEIDGNAGHNTEAIKAIILAEKEAGMGYASVNHPVDRCPECGYTGIIDNKCPKCNKTEDDGILFERIRRITGYLVGSLNRWNSAKRAEEAHRKKHWNKRSCTP